MTWGIVLLLVAGTALGHPHHHHDASEAKRLIQVAEESPPEWRARSEIDELTKLKINFMDVTDHPHCGSTASCLNHTGNKYGVETKAFPHTISRQSVVNPILGNLSPDHLKATCEHLQTYFNRYYTTADGKEAAEWIHAQYQKYLDEAGRTDGYVQYFEHSWLQPSVIATLQGTTKPDEIIVIGAHLDSTGGGATRRGPGADDDGSGCANNMDMFKAMLTSGYRPKRTLQFMGFAAEEVGLRGSQDIATSYANENKNVYAMLNFEMSGYKGDGTMTVLTDYTNKELTQLMQESAKAYSNIPVITEACGYACSDHASFFNRGFATVCCAEAGPRGNVNPYMHTANDLTTHLDFEFSNGVSKMALGWIVEMDMFEG